MRQDAAEPAWERRIDRGALLSAVIRPDGSMLCEGFACREGVLPYLNADGSTRLEFVPLSTLDASAAGLGRAPVTLQHPDPERYPQGVTPENFGVLGVGDTDGEVEVRVEDGGFVKVRLAVRRADALAAVHSGTVELSPGYDVKIDPTPGSHPKYGRYDCVQTERRYNHLAIVDMARGGPEIKLRADTLYSTETITGATHTTAGGSSPGTNHPTTAGASPRGATVNNRFIPVLTLLGITRRVDSDDAALDVIEVTLRARKDAEEAVTASTEEKEKKEEEEKSAMQAALDEAKSALGKMQAECDALKAGKADMEAKADRAALAPLAAALKVDSTQHATVRDLRKAIATAHLGSALRADATDAVVDAMVDLAAAARPVNAATTSATAGFDPYGTTATARGESSGERAILAMDGAGKLSMPQSPLQRARAKQEAARKGNGSTA